MSRHRQWLEGFKEKLRKKKEDNLIDQIKEVDKIEKVASIYFVTTAAILIIP